MGQFKNVLQSLIIDNFINGTINPLLLIVILIDRGDLLRAVWCTNYIANIQRIINEIRSLAPRFLADSELGIRDYQEDA